MDLDDFRSVLETAGVDVWTFIDTAIQVAAVDYEEELKLKRDGIVEKLYSPSIATRCRNCDVNDGNEVPGDVNGGSKGKGERSPLTPQSGDGNDDLDPFGGLFDDEEDEQQKRILEIKDHLEVPDLDTDSVLDLLQSLADMDITFKVLKETDIGRHVNRLRKHPSNDVKRIVKTLVRRWKEIVDEWVRLNQPGEAAEASALMVDEDSPQQKFHQNGHREIPDFAYSPNPHYGSSGSDKNISEPERKPKPKPMPPRKEPQPQPKPARTTPPQNVPRQREQKEPGNFDADQRLASARKRLQANYKEAENAKKQRTIQVMDIHDLPKPKARNAFFAKHKPGGSQGRHW